MGRTYKSLLDYFNVRTQKELLEYMNDNPRDPKVIELKEFIKVVENDD